MVSTGNNNIENNKAIDVDSISNIKPKKKMSKKISIEDLNFISKVSNKNSTKKSAPAHSTIGKFTNLQKQKSHKKSSEIDYDLIAKELKYIERKKSKKCENPKTNNSKFTNSKLVKIAISALHLLSIILFSYALLTLALLPTSYSVCIIAINIAIWIPLFIIHTMNKIKTILTKIIALVCIFLLLIGSLYLVAISNALNTVAGENQKIDVIKVVTNINDPAEDIQDAKEYTFGVQYNNTDADMIRAAQTEIEDKIGKSITVKEFASVKDQADAIINKEVNAIIYNDAYTPLIDDTIPEYSAQIKEIFRYEIITDLENSSGELDVTKDPFTVVISGIDQYGDIAFTGRSDVNILFVIDPVSREILLVNTPRDTFLEFPEISNGMNDKLTHAGIYGIDATMNALANFYETDIDFFARINFTSLIDIVDALGGIEVNSEYGFTTSFNSGHIVTINKGSNQLDGVEALAFSRERKNVPGGDFTRGKNQEAVIEAIIEKAISPTIITAAPQILSDVSDCVETNMQTEQIQALIQDQLAEGLSFDITSTSLTGTTGSGFPYSTPSSKVSVVYPDELSRSNISMQIKALTKEDFSIFEAIKLKLDNIVAEKEKEKEEKGQF